MRLIDAGMMSVCARLRGREVTREEALGVHSPEAWQALEAATADKESPAAKEASAARTAAGCVLEMAMAVVKGDLKNGVALVRPCGRRVGRDLAPYVFLMYSEFQLDVASFVLSSWVLLRLLQQPCPVLPLTHHHGCDGSLC